MVNKLRKKSHLLFLVLLTVFWTQAFNIQVMPQHTAAALSDLFEDFEGSVFPAWTATGLWHIEDNDTSSWPLFNIPSASHYAWYGDNSTGDFNTSTRNNGYLISDFIDLTATSGEIELGFMSRADTETDYYDRKNVSISADGGSTWDFLGNVSVSSGWQHYAFDITAYADSSNVVVRFSFDSMDDEANDGFGWMIDDIYIGPPKEEFFELEIYQDYYAYVDEEEMMGFNATSYFKHDMNVSINITIVGPSGSKNLYYSDITLMNANGSSWFLSIEYNFAQIGYYEVFFILIDDIFAEWVESCHFDVYDRPTGYFDIFVDQDNTAYVNEWVNFSVGIYSFFATYEYFITEVNISDSSGYNEQIYFNSTVGIPADSTWMINLEYNFTSPGHYYVVFSVWDENGTWDNIYCSYDVVDKPEEHFEIWIEQRNFAIVNETEHFTIGIDSFYSTDKNFTVEVNMTDYYSLNETIYFESDVIIPSYGTWMMGLNYDFSQVGHYDAVLSVWDENGTLERLYCYFDVYDESKLDLWIMQPFWAIVGQPTDVKIQIQNFDDYTTIVDYFRIEMIEYNETKDIISNMTIYEGYDIYVVGFYEYSFTYTFDHIGHYEVHAFMVDEYGRMREQWCPFDVYMEDDDFLVLRIEQMKETWIDLPVNHWIFIDSHFNYGQDIDLELTIFEEGTTVGMTIFIDTIWVEGHSFFKIVVPYEFEQSGEYQVQLTAIDENNNEWETWCWWHVRDPEPNTLTYSVIQDSEAMTGEEVWHYLNINSYYDFGQNIKVEVWANHHQEGVFVENFLIFESTQWIDAGGSIMIDFSWVFDEYGHYDLDFRIWTDSDEYETWCFWEIWQPWHGYDLWFEPYDDVATVGSTIETELNIISNFGHSMNVELNVYLNQYDENGYLLSEEIVFHDENLWMENQQHRIIYIIYTFTSEGHYEFHAVLIDDGGGMWDTFSFWDVFGEEPITTEPYTTVKVETEETLTEKTLTEDTDGQGPPEEITPGFESLLIIVTMAAVATYLRKRFK